MSLPYRDSIALIAPFALWMVLMSLLPSEPWSYAVRTAIVGVSILYFFRSHFSLSIAKLGRSLAWGIPAGLLVLFIWVAPEDLPHYRDWFVLGGTANAPVDSSAWYWKAARLFGSAFVISIAEELFFRRWLVRWAGFWPMIALFAIEHDRWLVGALAGLIYGVLALRRGLLSAMVAHAVTNFGLGLWVLWSGDWRFW